MIILWTFLSASFVVSGLWLILSAAGLRVNWSAGKIEKSVLLFLDATPSNVNVFLNDKLLTSRLPARVNDILPGSYDLKFESAGLQPWARQVNLEGGQAYDFNTILLVLNQPVIEDATAKDKADIAQTTKPTDLMINDDEILASNGSDQTLITRLSSTVQFVNWYPDKKHLVYQVDHKIVIVDLDGSNPRTLVELNKDTPSVFFFTNGGKALIYKDGDMIKRAKIKP